MALPSQFRNINGRRYIRGIFETTKANALARAAQARKEGLNARAVKQDNGKWAVYHQWIKMSR